MTYSIVARCERTGHIGAAIQSHWFCVGRETLWISPGVGAVATQSFVSPRYGSTGLRLLEAGCSPKAALLALLEDDPTTQTRQVAIIDANGRIATHTGGECIPFAEHLAAEGVSCQSNLMRSPGVPKAMLTAFLDTCELMLEERLLAALAAAQAAGGDLRGQQSAALAVASPTELICNLRVDDNPAPLRELDRLLTVSKHYRDLPISDCQPPLREDVAAELRFWKAPDDAKTEPWLELSRRLATAR